MSKHRIGGIMQLGYVVDDLDAAMAHWARELGVGPFFVNRHAKYETFDYLGANAAPDVSLAFAYSGDTNIELIQQHDDTPSPFLAFRKAYGQGLQHVGVLSDDIEAEASALRERGVGLVLRLVNAGSLIETRFFDTEFHPGAMLELIARTPQVDQGFAFMRRAAADWDGQTLIGG